MTDVAQPSHLKRAGCVLAVVLVFVLLGPPVGALVFMLTTALIGFGKGVDLAGLTWVALFAVIYAVPFSYLIGVVPAAAAGLLVGVRQAYFGPATAFYAAGAGLLVGICLLWMSGQRIGSGSDASTPVMLATCFVSTLVCWTVVRGWHFAHTLAGQST